MKMGMLDRLVAMRYIPQEGSYVTLKIIRVLVTKLGISAEEHKEYNIREEGDKIFWDEKANEEREIPLTDIEISLVSKGLKKADEEGKLKQEEMGVYEKFVMRKGDTNASN